MKIRIRVLPLILVAALSGCASNQPLPLLFGQTQTVGLTINGSVPEQGGELSLAYRDRNIAVIPIQSPAGAQFDARDGCSDQDLAETTGKAATTVEQKPATDTKNQSTTNANQKTATNANLRANCTRDTFSVFGQFELNGEAQPAGVGLGKFFATGFAARKLADGFAERLKNANVGNSQPKSADTTSK